MTVDTLDTEAPESRVAFSHKHVSFQAPMVVNEIVDDCLYTGLFGSLDSARMKAVTDRILETVGSTNSDRVIIDLANIEVIDTMVANHLFRLGKTLGLTGTSAVFCGIKPVVAQTMVNTGVDVSGVKIVRNLKQAVAWALERYSADSHRVAAGPHHDDHRLNR